jgi:hypothetical protein
VELSETSMVLSTWIQRFNSNYFRYSDAPHITDASVLIVTCLSAVDFLMFKQISFMNEDISADVTLVLFDSNMSQLMLPEDV